MDDALRAKSRPPPAETGTRASNPPVSQVPCATCGGTAHVQPNWTPPPGLDPNLWQFRCILGHDTYRAIRHHRTTTLAHGPRFDPGSGS